MDVKHEAKLDSPRKDETTRRRKRGEFYRCRAFTLDFRSGRLRRKRMRRQGRVARKERRPVCPKEIKEKRRNYSTRGAYIERATLFCYYWKIATREGSLGVLKIFTLENINNGEINCVWDKLSKVSLFGFTKIKLTQPLPSLANK